MPSQSFDIRASLLKYAANILNRRPYFRHKLREKLVLRAQKTNIPDANSIIEGILDDLAKSGYLNDAYLADSFVRRQLDKGYGPKIIAMKLKYLKLNSVEIKNSLEKEADKEAQKRAIQHYATKNHRLDQRKLISKLLQRGFEYYQIKDLFDSPYIED